MSIKRLPSVWRKKNGQFARKLKGVSVVSLLVLSIMGMRMLEIQREHDDLMKTLHPISLHSQLIPEDFFKVEQVKASGVESTSAPAPQIEPSIEDRIRMRFGKYGDTAVKIARCESGIRAEAVGDKTLTFTKGGKTYGDSHGMFQIRHLPGRPSVEDLHDVNTNIEEAWKISKGGTNWGAWVTCSRKAGI